MTLTKEIKYYPMKIKTLLIVVIALMIIPQFISAKLKKEKQEFYQLTVYHYTTVEQEKILDDYFQQALIPSLHEMGVRSVGFLRQSLTIRQRTNRCMFSFR